MQQEELKDLLHIFDQSSLTEFDLKEGSFELYFNKNNTPRNQTTAPVSPVDTTASMVQQATAENAVNERPVAEKTEKTEGTAIVSPIVGVVYLSPAPDQADFKKVGDHVEKGEVVCIVEAMKVMNEITSDISGEIVEVAVENEQVVEYGQSLFFVKEG